MKKTILIISLICMVLGAEAKTRYKYYPNTELRPDRTVFLYVPTVKEAKKALKQIPDPTHAKKAETLALTPVGDNGYRGQENMFDPNGATFGINEWARFDLYFPKESNGKMVVVTPGGGYNCVCHYIEGIYAADWFVERGYTVAVVKYRLPNGDNRIPLSDVHNVLRYAREHQQEWGISKIGIIGFSAGGHLAASASVLYDDAATRPDFSILVYPVISVVEPYGHVYTGQKLIGNYDQLRQEDDMKLEALLYKYNLFNMVTPDTPPTFMVLSADDKEVEPMNSIAYYHSLVYCGVPSELHIYQHGIHGFGFNYYKFTNDDWLYDARDNFFEALERWLSNR
ncbi:MAG: alpha/beta hydrolase [Bacteroidales bacterium]|nr:alpha/beta hydrolase [Bacteroidales bacterium]